MAEDESEIVSAIATARNELLRITYTPRGI
jgi:hypothetical protein